VAAATSTPTPKNGQESGSAEHPGSKADLLGFAGRLDLSQPYLVPDESGHVLYQPGEQFAGRSFMNIASVA
jgi:hypothetical protein